MIKFCWGVASLPTIECYLPDDLDAWPEFEHIATNVREGADEGGRRIGDTIWGGVVDGQPAALAWDWVEIRPGVPCLLDPNHMSTNLRFLDGRNTYQEPLQSIISMNRLTHRWAWQPAVLDALRSFALAEAPSTKVLPRILPARRLRQGVGELRHAA